MAVKCLFGHKWNGCKCDKCGTVRDEEHTWDMCKGVCTKCGRTQPERHEWDGCRCRKCGKTRNEGHEWDLCKGICKKCGKTQPEQHQVSNCVCRLCGKEVHEWSGSICRRCGKPRNGDASFKSDGKVLIDFQSKHGFPMHIAVTENEVLLGPFHIALRDIKKVILHPIQEEAQGMGGWIKFITEDNPNLPETDDKYCWRVLLNNEYAVGSDIIRGNVFFSGCAYKESYNYKEEEGIEKINDKMADIAILVNQLISQS